PVGGVVRYTNLSENGPFNQWAWEFEGGTPAVYNDSTPPPIAYLQVGTYDVTLRCRKTNNIQDQITKYDYITVIPKATTPPIASFTANYTVVQPGDPINFIDLSSGNPYQWTWEFPGSDQETSNQKHPMGITYPEEGVYSVRLTVGNNFGVDVMLKEMYITVSVDDPCSEAPTVDFNATSRLIPAGGSVNFFDLSEGLPTYHTWTFDGGNPASSNEGSPTTPIQYSTEGIYNVSLTVSNSCGSSTVVKQNYIYVFSSPVGKYCDTITTIKSGEVVEPRVPDGQWGYLAGHNGLKIREYANRFDAHTFSEVSAVLVPVNQVKYDATDSYVKFYVADANYPTPDSILGEKKVYLYQLTKNETNLIKFEPPISVNGPFYVGYKINYPDEDNDGFSDDMFVVGIAAPRYPNLPENNQLYMKKGSTWYTANDMFNFGSALPLKPIACLVDVEEIIAENDINIYPNPTTGLVTIKIKDTYYSSVSFEIYDIMGRKVVSEIYKNGVDEFSTDLSNYPEGLYIIRMKLGNLNLNKKILLTK
ncbi:MAG TPA: PKD domain-containing protein, partial [Bacteroidales bacterium]|nr:PKD domain-containing protein [Bacteroidales bacterium]